MTAQHTPGPWALGIETKDGISAQVIAADGSHIAYVECDPVDANARLIAAAPELLAVAEMVLASATIETPSTLIETARAAIAKAEGR